MLAQLVASAGIGDVTITSQAGVARFPSVRFMVEADLRGCLPVMGVVLSEDQIHRFPQEAQHAFGSFVAPSGTMVFDLSAHLVSGTKSSDG